MSPGQVMFLTAGADFVGGLGTAVTAAMIEGGKVALPSKAVWIFGALMGAIAFASHVKASLAQPAPRTPAVTGGGGG